MNLLDTITVKRNLGFICEKCYSYFIVPTEYHIPKELLKDVNLKLKPLDMGSYQSMLVKCPRCNKKSDMFDVDEFMAPIISLLNKLNFKTIYSCQGHCHGITKKNLFNICTPYVDFDCRGKNKHVSKKLFNVFHNCGWTNISESTGDEFINRYSKEDNENYDFIFTSRNYIVFHFDYDTKFKEYNKLLCTKNKAFKVYFVNSEFRFQCIKLYNELLKAFKDDKRISDLKPIKNSTKDLSYNE